MEKVKFLLESKIINIKNKLKIYRGDIKNLNFIEQIFKDAYLNEKIDAVIHFAGLKSVNESILVPLKYWDFNLKGTINLLKIIHYIF